MKHNSSFKSIGIILLSILVLSSSAIAQKKPKDTLNFPKLNPVRMPKIERTTLKNGMELFLVEDHDYPTISMRAVLRSGSVYEPADEAGLADITGMVLRTGGTKSMTGDELDEKLETMAASIETDIGTSSGYVGVSLLKEDIDVVLSIMSDMLRNPVFDEEKIELAKMQHRTAISRRNDNILSIANREFFKLIYGTDSPYTRQTEYASIDAITRDDIIAFYERFIHPNNIMMAVWGDFKTKDIIGKFENIFGDWQSTPLDIPSLPEVDYAYRYTVNYIDKPDVNQSNILLGHIGGLKSDPDYAALAVMNRILSFDRMFKRIRTDEGLAYTVWGDYGTQFSYPGVFSAGAQTKSQSTVYAVELMIQEMERMMTEEVTDEEITRAKDQFLNSYVFQFDSKSKIVNQMMTLAYFGYPLDFSEKFIRQVEDVTKADILQAAKSHLHPDAVQILVVGRQQDFDKPLSDLGTVNTIDISIPAPKAEEAPEATAESLTKGRELLEQAVAASGGPDVIRTIKNMKTSLDLIQVTPMGEVSMAGEILIVYPDRMKGAMQTPMGEVTIVITGDEGWMVMPGQGSIPIPENQKQVYRESFLRDPVVLFTRYEEFKIQYVGKRKLGDTEAEELLISAEGHDYHLLLDASTYLPAGYVYNQIGQQGPETVVEYVSEYKETAGFSVPMKSVSTVNENKVSETVVQDIQFNVEVDPAVFQKE